MNYNKESNYGIFEGFAFKLIDNNDHQIVGYADEELNSHATDEEYYDWEQRLWAKLEAAE